MYIYNPCMVEVRGDLYKYSGLCTHISVYTYYRLISKHVC